MAKQDKLVDQAKTHLDDGEPVLGLVHGTYETKIMGSDSVRKGLFLATERRLVFYAKKLGGYEFESFPYDKISSFEQGKNMMGHNFSFFTSGNKVTLKWISKDDDFDSFIAVTKQHLGGSTAAALPGAATQEGTSSDDIMKKIRQLGDLHDAGVLTDDEFSRKKAELLARL